MTFLSVAFSNLESGTFEINNALFWERFPTISIHNFRVSNDESRSVVEEGKPIVSERQGKDAYSSGSLKTCVPEQI